MAALTLEWPDQHLWLIEPWKRIFDDTARFTKLAIEREVRGFGFSETGKSLNIATSSDVTVFRWTP